MQGSTSQNIYQGSAFRKYDAYDDEPYEIVQEPTELTRYPTVDDITAQNGAANSANGIQKEPSSPTFNYAVQSATARPSTNPSTARVSTTREGDYNKQMAQKIKRQAEQLHELSNYKVLCEKRILDLAPGHPLPVLPSHLGTSSAYSQQIADLQEALQAKDEEVALLQSQVKQYSSRKSPARHVKDESLNSPLKFIGGDDGAGSYNVLSAKYKALLEEKQNLEESLRNETLVNEEQRAYTEVLKRLLDEKFDALNLAKWITGLPEVGKIDAVLELKTLNDRLNQQQSELEYYQQNYQSKNVESGQISEEIAKLNQKNEELSTENLKLTEVNIRLNQAVKTYETEFKNLEEEKSNLIDFADEQASRAEKVANDYNELKERYESIDEANKELIDQLNEASNQINSLQEQINELQNVNAELKEQIDGLQEKYEHVIEENQQLTRRNDETQELLKAEAGQKKNGKQELAKLRQEVIELTKQKDSKERELDAMRKQMEEINKERTRLQETVTKKEHELNVKLSQLQNEYEAEIHHLEEQGKAYEDNEINLKSIIDKNNNEITKILKQLNNYKEQNKQLEGTLEEFRSLNNLMKTENFGLKDALEKINSENYMREEDDLMVSQELSRLKDEAEVNFYKVTELSNLNSTLEKKLTEKDREIQEYEEMVNDAKKRLERERQQKLDEVKRLCDENSELKQDLHTLKEEIARYSKNLSLKEEELNLVKANLDKKTQQTMALAEENRLYKQKAEDLYLLQEQLNNIKMESDRNARNIREYEEQIENKTSSLKNTLTKLDTAEQELFSTLSTLKELQRERADLLAENTRLQKKVEDLKEERERSEIDRAAHEEQYLQLVRDNEKAQKNLSRAIKDLEDLTAEYNKLVEEVDMTRDEEKSYRNVLHQTSDIVREMLIKVKQYVGVYNEMLASSPDVLLVLGKKFRSLLETFDGYQYLKEGKEVRSTVLRSVEDAREVMEVLLEELENLGRRVGDLKQDITAGNQRIATLERKCMNMNTEETQTKQREMELKREAEMLRDENELLNKDKSNAYAREIKVEKENAELKKEVGRLQNEIKDLRGNLKTLDQENTRLHSTIHRQQEHHESRIQDISSVEEKSKIAQKEKKSYEEILQRLCGLFANQELQKLIMDIVKLQSEIHQVEREKNELEVKLSDMESDYKLYIKKTPNLSPARSSTRRSEIEMARSDLNNAVSQLSILLKRKSILFEELKSFEMFEKRRYDSNNETEKSLYDARRQLQELKSQNQGLDRGVISIKDSVKTISKERQNSDYESVRQRYSNLEGRDLNNMRTFTGNKYTEGEPIETSGQAYNLAEREDTRKELKREGRSETQRILAGASGEPGDEQDGWDPRPVERSFTDRNAVNRNDYYFGQISNNKETSYSRHIEHETSQIRLKDRLNQAKNILSSMRKSFEREHGN